MHFSEPTRLERDQAELAESSKRMKLAEDEIVRYFSLLSLYQKI
jgi:hypothetical protein